MLTAKPATQSSRFTYHKMHTILLGVVGTIYEGHTDTSLSKMGLDHSKFKKVTSYINTPSNMHQKPPDPPNPPN